MDENSIEKIVDDTIHSFDGAKRAEPRPFLLTRVLASLNRQPAVQNEWTRIGAFLSRPGIAIAGIVLIMLINTGIVFISKNNADKPAIVQSNSTVTDEFAVNADNIYDIENLEP